MRCPRCGFMQSTRVACARCGSLLATAAEPKAPRRRPPGRWLVDALWIAATAGGLVLAVRSFRASSPRPAETTSTHPAAGRASPPPRNVGAVRIVPAGPRSTATPMPAASSPTPTPATCPLFAIASPLTPSRRPVSREWAVGAEGFADAEREQRETRAPMLVYVYTDWCRYCRRLEQELLDTFEVERYLADELIKVRINPDKGESDGALAHSLGVGGYPTLLLIFDGRPAERISPYVQGGDLTLLTPAAFVQEVAGSIGAWLEDSIADAQQNLARRDYDRAAENLAAPLAVRPDDARLYLERGNVRARQGDLAAALEDWRQAADLGLEDLAIQELALTLAPLERWDEVAACWTRVIERQPAGADARAARALALARKGDLSRALDDARAACRLGAREGCELARRLDGAAARAAGS